jgi:hypothetical protein
MNRFTRFAAAALFGAACCAMPMHWLGTSARADVAASPAAPAPRFLFRMISLGSTWQGYRIDTTTGDGVYVSGTKWVKLGDDTPPGPGNYDLQMVALPDAKTYQAVRVDLLTGRTWYVGTNKWVLITDQ